MPSSSLKNYLLTHRKRLSLSQDDVAFLLGCMSGAKVSRYEQFRREPSFKTALAFEAIFRRPISELFAGMYEEVEKEVVARAEIMERSIRKKGTDSQRHRKLPALAAIAPRTTK